MAQRSRSSKCARLSAPPPPPKAPCFRFFFNQAYLECPNLYLSPQPVFGRIGHNGSEIQVLKKCSTIRPRSPKRPHVSDFFLTKHIWNAPTCTFHHNLFLVELVTMPQRSRSSKCARLSAPPPPKGPMFQIFLNQAYLECPNLYLSPDAVFGRIGHNGSEIQVLKVCSTIRPRKKAPCFSFFEPNIFGMPQPMPFPRTCFSSNWSQWLRDPRPQSVLEYLPPPKKVPMFQNFFEPSILGRPQPVPFTGTCFWSNWSQWLRDPRPQRVLDYQPQKRGPMFQIFFNQAYLECPNLCLSPKPVFGRIGHNGSEIQVLQICSTIRPRKKAPCFRFFLNQAYLECPNLYLSPEAVFGRIGHNGSEIHVLKVCSTIPPPPQKAPCFRFF